MVYYEVYDVHWLSARNGISELVMDSLQGSIPSVILFPATWNATLLLNKNDALRNAFRQIIGSLSVTSTVTMVGSSIITVDNKYHVHLERIATSTGQSNY